MIGDADAIESESPVKIHQLRHSQNAIGVVAVDVKVAKHHARTALGPRPPVAFVLIVESSERASSYLPRTFIDRREY